MITRHIYKDQAKSFGEEILHVHPDVDLSKDSRNEKCLIVCNEQADETEELEEIYWKGRTVIVGTLDEFRNQYVLKNCFTVDSDVKDVLHANFHLDEKSSGLSRCLCVLEKECISVFTDVGEQFIASLPFKVKRVWALENGLCVERETVSLDNEDDKGMPTLFSLMHPLEDFKPVVYYYKDNRKPMYFNDTSQHIVYTCPESCLVMTYDSVLGLHSLWKARKATEQDFPEITSHQDSLPEFVGFMNQSPNVATNIKDHSRLSTSPATIGNKRHSCPPIPMHLQRRNSPAKVIASPINKAYSPVLHGHRGSPYHGAHVGVHDSSHGMSEFNTPRRTHGTSSLLIFRMSCADTKLDEEPEPLPPNVCLEQIWQEPGNMIRYGLKGKAETAFVTRDFFETEYVAYQLKAFSKLRLLKGVYMKSHSYLSYEKVLEIECSDAGVLKNCQMFVILDLSQTINLYTGKQKIMTVRMPEGFSGIDITVDRFSLSHFAGSSFNISCTSSEAKVRMQIPKMCSSNLVYLCISTLRKVLNENDYNLVHAKFYAMLHNKTLNEQKLGEWELFIKASLKLLGFPESSLKSLKEDICSPAPPEPKKAKKSDSMTGSEDWEYLLSSRPNKCTGDESLQCEKKFLAEISLQKNAPLYQYFGVVYHAWRQLYEELKLNILESVNLLNFAKFLQFLSIVFSANQQAMFYAADHPIIKAKLDTVYKLKEDYKEICSALQSRKQDLWTSIEEVMKGTEEKICTDFSGKFSTTIIKVFTAMMRYIDHDQENTEQLFSQMKLSSGNETLLDAIINIMTRGDFKPTDLENLPIAFKLPIKEILYFYKDQKHANMSLETAMFLGRDDIIALKQNELTQNKRKEYDTKHMDGTDEDGMTFDEEILKFRFNQDLRVNEVKRLLNSSMPVNVTVQQKPDVNDIAYAKEEEARLLLISKRTMSLSIGRGMFTLGTSQADASKTVAIPLLDLSGHSTTNNKTIQISQTEMDSTRLLWPEFHNGVAAGLKIDPGSLQIDSTWILFNKLKCSDLKASHSGFLFALGLMGDISSLPKLHLHDYLIKGHELTTVALLMGMAATQIGTKNTDTYKLLCLHVVSLLPPTALELSIPRTSEIASIFSLGLLFFGTCDMHLVKVLLREIGRSPGVAVEDSIDRESHALASGMALGMIMIGQGTDNTLILDANVLDILYHYVNGGQKKDHRLDVENGTNVSGQLNEGDMINADVTAPAAIMALALMYLKTNNGVVANMLRVNSSDSIMDTRKPDHVIYQTISYNLIMWNDLKPTEAWLTFFLPGWEQLMESFSGVSSANDMMNNNKLDLHYRLCIVTGCLFALAIKFAGSCNLSAFNLMFPWIKVIRSAAGSSFCQEIGGKVVLEQCLNTTLISLALEFLANGVYRGTAKSMEEIKRYDVFMTLMAGSGNIKVLRIARQLYKRCCHNVSYGNHMSVHMAIGFLFLGGGRYTLKTDDIAIASLLCSLYPKWPANSKDNRFHLQALRHLYVLACEPRLFITRDVDTRAICYTPITVTLKETSDYQETTYKLLSPCFIPESKSVKEIVTLGPRYWSVTLHSKGKSWIDQIQNVFVKKKAGYLSYSEDPKGFRNLLGRTFTNQSEKLECVKAFNSSPNVLLFEKLFCKANTTKSTTEFFTNILCQCVRQEKLDVLSDYLAIEKIVCDVENDVVSVHGIRQLSLLFTYYSNVYPKLRRTFSHIKKDALINRLYITQCWLRLERQVTNIEERDFESKRPLHFHALKELFVCSQENIT